MFPFRLATIAAFDSVSESACHAAREPLLSKKLCSSSARFACHHWLASARLASLVGSVLSCRQETTYCLPRYFLIHRRWRDCQPISSLRGIVETPQNRASPLQMDSRLSARKPE